MNGINFYDLLYESLNETNNTKIDLTDTYIQNTDNDNLCLITLEPLEQNYIKLLCGHTFNYEAIYLEVYNQKCKKNYNETQILSVKQIKCPYCRNIQNKLLPQNPKFKKKHGVNSPSYYCMVQNKCAFILKNGKRKGETCEKSCFHKYCNIHIKSIEKQKKKQEEKLYNISNKCKAMIKTGKNKGEICGKKCQDDYCKRHLQKKQEENSNNINCNSIITNNIIIQNDTIEINNNEEKLICDKIICEKLMIGDIEITEENYNNLLDISKYDIAKKHD